MPDFEFTAPGGKKYTVTGPAGSTPEQAFQMLQTQMGGAIPAAPDSAGKAQGKRIMSAVDQVNHEEGNLTLGLGEAALNMATGIGSTAVGGMKAMWDTVSGLANGKTLHQAATTGTKSLEAIQHDYTYQPRTGVGKLSSELLTVPVMAAKSAMSSMGGDIGQAINGQTGREYGEAIGDIAPDIAATLLGGRAALRSVAPKVPAIEQAPPAVNLDVPAYQRQVGPPRPLPEIAGPPKPPVMAGLPKPAPVAASAVPVLPEPAAMPATMRSPLEAYAEAPAKSPYGELLEPLAPEARAVAQSPLDAYVGQPETAPRAAPNQFDDMLRESPPVEAPKSPLEAMAAGEPASPAAKITASLRDTSDIDGILQSFGVKSPEAPIPGPVAMPEPVAPAPMPGPARPVAPEVAAAPAEAPFVPTPEQHVNPALREHHMQALRDIGLENIRESAVTGNAAQAAREFQHGKITSEPAGMLWFDQFQAETDAMKSHAQRLVDQTGGRTGLDESALTRKGMDIAAPYDAARGYFEKAKKSLYDIAEQRAKETGAVVATESVDALLVDPDFRATLMAKDQQGLLSTIESQYARFKALDESGLSVVNAEKFRKWLNKVWSPDKSGTLGEVKSALDRDVFKSAGEDVYAQGRQMHMLERQTLDAPNGIAKLMDTDPNTPVNRSTPYEKIPDKIMTLSEGQFKHIIDTYRELPPELQPLAQQAIDTLKAHYAERMLDTGTETGRGNPRQLWNAGGVKTFVADNSSKIPMIFDAGELAQIDTMLKAGEVLRVNQAYPGAAAQLANASKAGMMSHLLGRAGGGIGGLAGALVGGPAGAGAGALGGEAAAGALLKRSGERKALAEAKAAIINEHRQARKPMSPVEEWESGLRP